MSMKVSEPPRIAELSHAAFSDWMEQERGPVVLTCMMKSWRAVGQWTAEYLAEKAGDVDVRVAVSGGMNVFGVDPRKDRTVTSMLLREYLATLGSGESRGPREQRYYLQKYPVNHFPELEADFELPPFLAGRKLFATTAWISGEQSITPMHFDMTEGVIAQVQGDKRFLLFEPDLKSMSPYPWYSKAPHFSGLPLATIAEGRFPEGVNALEFVLRPGEMLYIPSPWWHQVYSLSPCNASVVFWWLPTLRKAVRYWNHTLRSAQMEGRRRLAFGGGLPGERTVRRAAAAR
jgi:hypothetical protein